LQDVPLFEGIISDLFPGVELPPQDYDLMLEALKTNIAKKKLQAVPWFIDKIIQVRNTMSSCNKGPSNCAQMRIGYTDVFKVKTRCLKPASVALKLKSF